MSQTIVLPPAVTLSGHLYDALHNGFSNQTISLSPVGGGPGVSTTTNTSGSYSLKVSPGTYIMSIDGSNSSSVAVPRFHTITINEYSITENTVLDITLPAKKMTVHLQDAAGAPLSGITVSVPQISAPLTLPFGSGIFLASTNAVSNSSGDATLWLFANNADNPYTFNIIPPNGSAYTSTSVSNVIVTSDTNQTIVLQQPVIFSGHLYDAQNAALSNQTISLSPTGGGSGVSTITDAFGGFSLQASTGTYILSIEGSNSSSAAAPRFYTVTVNNYSLTENTDLDITLPAKRVNVHLQDSAGAPLNGITVGVPQISAPLTLPFGSGSYLASTNTVSNSSGDAILWLFANNTDNPYTLNVSPPSGSIYENFTINNIVVTSDMTELVSLQYNHAAPVTTATLETEHTDGTYSNPTTVTLAATAAAGYTVANTYYKVDGGSQQTYSTPFTVIGTGEHTLEYWSVDNSGVPEASKTKTFTIYLNQAPVVDPFLGATIDRGQTFTTTSFFTDTDSTSWTATVDYDEGAGEESLTLNPDKTFSLSHQYNTPGTYQVTVVVRDNQQATGTTQATVTVVVPDPVTTTFTSSADTYVRSGAPNQNEGNGQFMRIQASGDNRSLVQFNQTAMQSEIGNKQVLSAKLRVTITDNGNNWGATGRTIDVHRLIATWAEGNGTETDRGTGSGATWNCATDSTIENQAKNCSGTTEWEMGQANNPWVQTATATQTVTNNQSGVVEFDITADVADFLNGTNQNYGWIIKKTNEGQNGQVSFGTKESSSVPQLIVTYQP